MPPRTAVPASVVGQLQRWFGLSLKHLELHTGLSAPYLHKLSTGTRRLTPDALTALLPLLELLPPLEVQAAAYAATAHPPVPPQPAPLPAGSAPPDAADLALRAHECRHRAARLLAEAATLAERAAVAARWAAAAPALRPPDPDDPLDPAAAAYYAALPPDPLDPARPRDHARWLRGWLTTHARPLAAAETTRYHRLRAQAAGLLAEAAALEEGLPAAS